MSGAVTVMLLFASASLLTGMGTANAADAGKDPPLIVRFPNPNVFQSPYTWRNENGSAIAPTGGSYLKGAVTGSTSIRANVDTTLNAGMSADDMPTLKVTVDDQPAVFVQFPPAATQVTLAAITPAAHRYRVEVIGGNQKTGDSWRGTSSQTKIDSLQFDAGATLAPPAVRPRRALILGDSNIQAYFGEIKPGPYYKYVDYSLSWPTFVAFAFECEYGQIGVGSTGWIHPGQGGYPPMPQWWDHYDEKHLRDLEAQPDYVWVALGANDHQVPPARLQQVIQEFLGQARRAFPAAQILVLVPFHGENRAPVTAAATAAGDPRIHVIDLGTEVQSGIPFVMGQPTWMTGDGLHIRAVYHGMVAAAIARKSEAALQAPPSPRPAAPAQTHQ